MKNENSEKKYSVSVLRKMAHSFDWQERLIAAERNVNPNLLSNDVNPVVKATVAKHGRCLQRLSDDPNPIVRIAVASKGYDVKKMANDKNPIVRLAAVRAQSEKKSGFDDNKYLRAFFKKAVNAYKDKNIYKLDCMLTKLNLDDYKTYHYLLNTDLSIPEIARVLHKSVIETEKSAYRVVDKFINLPEFNYRKAKFLNSLDGTKPISDKDLDALRKYYPNFDIRKTKDNEGIYLDRKSSCFEKHPGAHWRKIAMIADYDEDLIKNTPANQHAKFISSFVNIHQEFRNIEVLHYDKMVDVCDMQLPSLVKALTSVGFDVIDSLKELSATKSLSDEETVNDVIANAMQKAKNDNGKDIVNDNIEKDLV